MTRWLYSFLIRLHPEWFRQRFGEQMLSVFDESVRQRGGIHLLVDAAISLLRQRLLRSNAAVARGMNLVWVLSVIPIEVLVALEINPKTQTAEASLSTALLLIFTFMSFYPLLNRGLYNENERFISISDASRQRQNTLARQRDICRAWVESVGGILLLCLAIWGPPLLIGAFVGGTRVMRSWSFVNVIVIAIQSLTYITIVKPVNKRALNELQMKIDITLPR